MKNCSTAVALYRKLCLLYWGLKLEVYRLKSKTGGGGGHMCVPLIPLPGSAFELTTDPELLSFLTQNCTYIDIALIDHNFVNCMSSYSCLIACIPASVPIYGMELGAPLLTTLMGETVST